MFERTDGPDSQPVAIVNERFVALFFKDRDPLGARIKLGQDDAPWRTIVGVVPDLLPGRRHRRAQPAARRRLHPADAERDQLHDAGGQHRPGRHELHRHDSGEVNRIDPALPLYWVRSLADQYALDTWFYRAFGTLFVAFGLAALVMATIGLYGVMSFSTGNRTREIGVRMALGAERRSVLLLILRQGLGPDRGGLALGLGVRGPAVAGPRHPAVRRAAVGPGRVRGRGVRARHRRHARVVHPGAAGHAGGAGRGVAIGLTARPVRTADGAPGRMGVRASAARAAGRSGSRWPRGRG